MDEYTIQLLVRTIGFFVLSIGLFALVMLMFPIKRKKENE